jgi:hypothetical protein
LEESLLTAEDGKAENADDAPIDDNKLLEVQTSGITDYIFMLYSVLSVKLVMITNI